MTKAEGTRIVTKPESASAVSQPDPDIGKDLSWLHHCHHHHHMNIVEIEECEDTIQRSVNPSVSDPPSGNMNDGVCNFVSLVLVITYVYLEFERMHIFMVFLCSLPLIII
jgi:hypothetical protein